LISDLFKVALESVVVIVISELDEHLITTEVYRTVALMATAIRQDTRHARCGPRILIGAIPFLILLHELRHEGSARQAVSLT
jgi:hypothetical protein